LSACAKGDIGVVGDSHAWSALAGSLPLKDETYLAIAIQRNPEIKSAFHLGTLVIEKN
jgi:hypothetical protein